MTASQRSVLQNADAVVFFKLREVLPSGENDFNRYSVVGWKRLSERDVVQVHVSQLLQSIDNDETSYPDSFIATFGARIWCRKDAVDVLISIDERLVHVLDGKKHRYCDIPKADRKKIAGMLAGLQWEERASVKKGDSGNKSK